MVILFYYKNKYSLRHPPNPPKVPVGILEIPVGILATPPLIFKTPPLG